MMLEEEKAYEEIHKRKEIFSSGKYLRADRTRERKKERERDPDRETGTETDRDRQTDR